MPEAVTHIINDQTVWLATQHWPATSISGTELRSQRDTNTLESQLNAFKEENERLRCEKLATYQLSAQYLRILAELSIRLSLQLQRV